MSISTGAATDRRLDQHPSVVEIFSRIASDSPDRSAIELSGSALTYRELADWASVIAARLLSAGLGPGSRVAIVGGRSPGMIASLVGTLAMGGVIVPIDASLPPRRKRVIAEESEVQLVISVDGARSDWIQGSTLAIPAWPGGGPVSSPLTAIERARNDPAYLFFTSGSTGTPKGVLGTHGGLSQFMTWMAAEFDVGPDDRVALTRSLSFDAVLREIFLPLVSGATIVVAPDPLDPDRALDWVARQRVTLLNVTPSHAEYWLEAPTPPSTSLRWVFFSGEIVTNRLVTQWRETVSPPGALVNLYGPTETTFIRSHHLIEDRPPPGPVAVGRPLPGTQMIVVGEGDRPCKPGCKGEVLIRTRYHTLGYVNSDGSDRFVVNPLTGALDDIVYRTGDVGWHRSDGSLVISGRIDHQVKILGTRIEPEEVEALLELHPQVRKASVVPVQREGRVSHLVAFVVADAIAPSKSLLRSHLADRLPSASVPRHFIFIEQPPLTSNGKVDRERLQEMAGVADVHELVTRESTFDTKSRINRLSPAKRALLQARLQSASQSSRTGVEARLQDLSPAKRALLQARLESDRSGHTDSSSRRRHEAPLSSAQERLWFLDRLHPGRSNYNLSRVQSLRGPLDVEALRSACDFVVSRHEVLRTRYVERDGEPVQVIDPPHSATFRILDLTSVDPVAVQEILEKTIRDETSTPFDLAEGPAIRFTVVRIATDEHVLLTVLHHIAGDGWSYPVLYDEMSQAYTATIGGGELDLDPLPIQYADYSRRQREKIESGGYDDDLRFWRSQLEGAPEVLDLPVDHPRPTVMSANGRRVQFTLSTARTDRFWKLAREETATGFMVGLAIYQAFLHELTGSTDLVVGVPSADRALADTQPLIGFLVNTLALRSMREPGATFRQMLRNVRQRVLRAFDHREVPFEHVVRELSPTRLLDRNPIFQVFFQFGAGNFLADPALPGVEVEAVERQTTTSKFDFTMYMGHDENVLTGSFVYNSDLFDEDTIGVLLDRVDTFAGRVLSEPDTPIEQLVSADDFALRTYRSPTGGAVDPMHAAGPRREGPLSFPQRRLWFLHRLDPEAGNYHIPWRTRLRGELSMPALQQAFDSMVDRHAVLRTRILDEAGTPFQVVDPPRPVPIDVIDARGLGTEQLAAELADESRAPFDLATDLMIRVKVFECADSDHVLSVVLHHIATDADSMALLRRELAEVYAAYLENRQPDLPALEATYIDVAAAQVEAYSNVGDSNLRWWLDTLGGELPILDLPTDFSRPLDAPREAGVARESIEGPIVQSLLALSESEKTTPFVTLLVAFAILLHRYSRQDDLVIGIPSTERTSVSLEGVMGFFVNSLPIRLRPSPDASVREFLADVRRSVLDALDHGGVPLEALVEHLDIPRDPSRNPVFQAMFDMSQAAPGQFSLPGLETVPVGVEAARRPAKFDLRAHAALRGDRLHILFEYRDDLFEPGTISDMIRQYVKLLGAITDDPDQRISGVDFIPERERVERVAQTVPTGTVLDALDSVMETHADTTAIIDGGSEYSYREVDEMSRVIAANLSKGGVRPGDTVGIRMPRGIGIVAATIGVLRAGGVYVPLDDSYPDERIDIITADAGLACVLTAGNEAAVPTIEIRERPKSPALDPSEQPCYVMYTSGSTGRPKGVVIPHRAILRLVMNPDYVSLGPDDVVAFASNTGFDAATFELWGALLNGAKLAVLDRDTLLTPAVFAEQIEALRISTMFVTTALFNTIVAQRPEAFSSLDTLLFGGEAVDPVSVRRCMETGPPRRLVHVYGPTETTTFAAWHLITSVTDKARTVPIGDAIRGTTLRVVDANLAEVPRGVPGELVIGGPGVGLGYLGDPKLTAEKFVLSMEGTEYRSGDLVRRRHDGAIEYLGRLDRQIKLRGFRVEPGEIESHLMSHPRVDEAVVTAHHHRGDLRLVAYVVGEVGAEEALDHLRGRVPGFMLPSAVAPIAAIPMTPNGKLDTDALPAPNLVSRPYEEPVGPDQERMAELWKRILDVDRVGATDDFFELGGHSLLAIELLSAIEKEFGSSAPLSALFEAPTVATLTRRVVRGGDTPEDLPVVTIRPGGDKSPLLCMPPAGGNVMVYEPMARAFERERPVLGLLAKGADGRAEPLRTIEAMAAEFEETIIQVLPDGPFALAGYSSGGLVAFETARRLHSAGRSADLVVLIDAHLVQRQRFGEAVKRDLRTLRLHGIRGGRVVGKRMALRARKLAGKLRHGPKVVWYRLRRRPLSPLLAGRKLADAGFEASTRYQPETYPGPVLYLVAEGLPEHTRSIVIEPWRAATTGNFWLDEIPGSHKGEGSVMHSPNAAHLASRIREALARLETGA